MGKTPSRLTRVAAEIAAAGHAQFASLAGDARAMAHALVDARIAELAASESFGSAARAEDQATVSIDDGGDLSEIAPQPGSHQDPAS